MKQGHSRARVRGFTLLETIVTLVIVSLLAAALMQSLGHFLNLRTRMLRLHAEVRMEALQEAWFRESISAALNDLPDAMGMFNGEADRIELLTAAAVGQDGIAREQWMLRAASQGNALWHVDARGRETVLIPAGLSNARFEYLDSSGTWRREWKADPDTTSPIPRLVRLSARTSRGELNWIAAIAAQPLPHDVLRPDGSADGI